MHCANKNEWHERQYCMRHVQITDYFNRQNKGDSTISSVQLLNIKWFGNQQTNHTDIQWNNVDDRNEIILFAFSIYSILIAITPWNQFHVPWGMESKFHKSFSLKNSNPWKSTQKIDSIWNILASCFWKHFRHLTNFLQISWAHFLFESYSWYFIRRN